MDASEIPTLFSSPEIGELSGALASAQAEFATVAKDNTAKVEPKNSPGYTYKYADLASCLAAVRGPLSRNGLCVMQTTVPGGQDLMLRTILAHKSGQWIASDFPLIASDWTKPQTIGSVITYVRRYTLCALLQIATDDDDGAAAQQHAEARKPARRPAAAAPGPEIPDYRLWIEDLAKEANTEWGRKHPDAKPMNLTIFGINNHLLKFLDVVVPEKLPPGDRLKIGYDYWRDNLMAMQGEAREYGRRLWRESAAKLKAAREPGGDDNLPSADEEAALDRLAGKGVAS